MRFFIVMLGFACASSMSFHSRLAHADSAERVALSLEEALARASATAPEVAFAEKAVRLAEARRVGAGVVMPVNPRLSADVRPTWSGASQHETGYGASVDLWFQPG